MNRATFIEQLKQTHELVAKLLALLKQGSLTSSPRISTRHADNTGASPSDRIRATRLLSARLFQATRLRRAWDSTATFAPGSTCCGFMNNIAAQNMQNRVKSDHLLAEH